MKELFEKFARVVSWTTIIGVFLFILLISYWMIYPYKTITVHNEPVPVANGPGIKRGNPVVFHMKWTKYTHVGAQVSRMLINCRTKEITIIYSGSSSIPAGDHDRNIVVPIPSWVFPGEYTQRTTYTYQVNPIRPVSVSWDSQPFTVKE